MAAIFQLENRVKILFIVKNLQIAVFDVTFCFFDNIDVTGLYSSHKPGVAGGARIWFNFPVNKKTNQE